MQTFQRPEICSQCGGKCCKRLPGTAHPSDFGLPSTRRLSAALRSGRWAIDWWEGDPREDREEVKRGYWIRPATKGKEGELYDGSLGGKCTFLTLRGCELSPEDRPLQCRLLEPRPGGHGNCKAHHGFTKREDALAWEPYWDLLDNIAERIRR